MVLCVAIPRTIFHPPVAGHLGISSLVLFQTALLRTFLHTSFCEHRCVFLFGDAPWGEVLGGPTVSVLSISPNHFPTCLYQATRLPAACRSPGCSEVVAGPAHRASQNSLYTSPPSPTLVMSHGWFEISHVGIFTPWKPPGQQVRAPFPWRMGH